MGYTHGLVSLTSTRALHVPTRRATVLEPCPILLPGYHHQRPHSLHLGNSHPDTRAQRCPSHVDSSAVRSAAALPVERLYVCSRLSPVLAGFADTGPVRPRTDRLENEHLGNMDQYRITREVPLPYSFDELVHETDAGDEDDKAQTRKRVRPSKSKQG